MEQDIWRRWLRDLIAAETEMDIEALRSQFLGDILTPGSKKYETSRRIWSDMIDRRAAALARCSGSADVRAVVGFAVDQEIDPAIRAGGHNVAGLAIVDDGPDTNEGHLCRSGTAHGDAFA